MLLHDLPRIVVILAGLHLSHTDATPTEDPPQRYHRVHPQMGTTFEFTLYANSAETAETALTAATQKLDDLNACLSDYLPSSELSNLSNSSADNTWHPVSDPLWQVLQSAQSFAAQTDGAFDITVGPLTRLWRQTRRTTKLPTPTRLAAALQTCGYRHIELDAAGNSARLAVPNMRLDLGGIAKGYAVDQAMAVLTKHGIAEALVNGGGDLRGIGRDWQVKLQDLDTNSRTTLTLNNMSAATSGDLYQSITIEGREFSHLIDPRTGLGLEHRRSVTVLAPDCMTADALASALSILPAEAASRVLTEHHPKASAKMLTKNAQDRLDEIIIGDFRQHLNLEPRMNATIRD